MKLPEMVANVDQNMKQLLNETNVNNFIGMFYIVALTARIPEIMIHNKKQTVKITL
jgi:hypothetical protein